MARGGYRPGAGRPKASGAKDAPTAEKDVAKAAKKAGLSPLEYMLDVMNDPSADDARRDRLAIAAAPFVHVKPAEVAPSVKAQRQAAGEKIAKGGGKFAAPAPPARLAVDNTR